MTTTPATTTTETKFFPEDINWFDVPNYLLTNGGGRLNEAITLIRGIMRVNIEETQKTVDSLLAEGAKVENRDKFVLLKDRLGTACFFAERLQGDLEDYDKDIIEECIKMKGIIEGPFVNKITALLFISTATEGLIKYFEGFEAYAMKMLKEDKISVEKYVEWVTYASEKKAIAEAMDFAINDAADLFEEHIGEMIENFKSNQVKEEEETEPGDDTNGALDALLAHI